jgi:hypothetical protein
MPGLISPPIPLSPDVVQQRVHQRAVAMAGGRVHDHPGRLVDDDEVGVLVEDVERQILRRGEGRGGLGHEHRDDRPGIDGCARAARSLAVDAHASLADEALELRPRVPFDERGEHLIEALPLVLVAGLDHDRLSLVLFRVDRVAGVVQSGRHHPRLAAFFACRAFSSVAASAGRRESRTSITMATGTSRTEMNCDVDIRLKTSPRGSPR